MHLAARGEVATVGLTTVDLTYLVPAELQPTVKTVATTMRLDVGGPAANAARTAALLGSRATLYTVLGAGLFAECARDMLDAEAVEVRDHTPVATDWELPVSTAIVDPRGHRTVVSMNAQGAPPPSTVTIPRGEPLVVLADGHHLELTLALTVAAPTAVVVWDAGSWKPGLERLLPAVDIVIASADLVVPAEFQRQFDSIAYRARTDGAHPVQLVHDGRQVRIPVPQVSVVDTLGAGDVLHGAFAHHLATRLAQSQLSFASVRSALTDAVQVAATSCQWVGVTGWAQPAVD